MVVPSHYLARTKHCLAMTSDCLVVTSDYLVVANECLVVASMYWVVPVTPCYNDQGVLGSARIVLSRILPVLL